MKTKVILFLFLANILLIACKPTGNKQNEKQENIAIEEQDTLTPEEQEFLASLDSVMDSYEEEVIVVVNKFDKPDKTDEPDNMEGLITIVDTRNGERYSDAPREYIKYEDLPDSLNVIIKTAKEFAFWYGENRQKLAQGKLIKYSDSLGYYVFDMNHGNFYLQTLKETGLVSDSLISYLRNMFLKDQIEFEKDKLGRDTDGPIGYVADILTNWQEQPPTIDTNEFIVYEISLRSNTIRIYPEYSGITLIYEKGHWLVLGY